MVILKVAMNLRKSKKGFMRGAGGKRKEKKKLCDYILISKKHI